MQRRLSAKLRTVSLSNSRWPFCSSPLFIFYSMLLNHAGKVEKSLFVTKKTEIRLGTGVFLRLFMQRAICRTHWFA
jgi:hypothetical protein